MKFHLPLSFLLLGGVSLANADQHAPRKLRGQAKPTATKGHRMAQEEIITEEVKTGEVLTPPEAIDDFATTDLGTEVVIDALANDKDPSNMSVNVFSWTEPKNGKVRFESTTQMFHYTPNPTFVGDDSFTYTIKDGDDMGDAARVTIVVKPEKFSEEDFLRENTTRAGSPANKFALIGPKIYGASMTIDLPTNNRFMILVKGNGPSTLPENVFDFGDETAENFALRYGLSVGRVRTSENSILIEPRQDYIGTETLRYYTTDSGGNISKEVTLNLVFEAPNSNGAAVFKGPSAVTLDVEHNDESVLPFHLNYMGDNVPRGGIVIGNGHPKAFPVVRQPTNGHVYQSGFGLTYEPPKGFTGVDSFTYETYNDSGEQMETVTVQMLPKGANRPTPPVEIHRLNGGGLKEATLRYDRPSSLAFDILLSGDIDESPSDAINLIDSATSTFELTDQPNSLTLSTTSQGFLVIPQAGYTGQDSLKIKTRDEQGNELRTFMLVLDFGSRGGDTTGDGLTGATLDVERPIDVPFNIHAVGIQGCADDDPDCIDVGDGSQGEIDITKAPSNGMAQLEGGNIKVTPTGGYVGNDTLVFRIKNGMKMQKYELRISFANTLQLA